MPIKKKMYKKKMYKRKVKVPRSVKPFGQTCRITRTAFLGNVAAVPSVVTYGGLSFKLDDLPSYSEFVNLFDQYHIAKIYLRFIPTFRNMNTGTDLLPWFMTAVDKDDAATPSVYTEIMQYPACKITAANREVSYSFTPRIATLVYNGVTSGYSSKSQYVDLANPSVPHYGFKYAMAPSTANDNFAYTIWAKYTVHFRGVR